MNIGDLPNNPSRLTERQKNDWKAKAETLVNEADAAHKLAMQLYVNALGEDKLDPKLISDRHGKTVASFEYWLDCCLARRHVYISLKK